MNFTTAVKSCVKDKYCSAQGRASRSEFWWFMLFTLLLYFLLPWTMVPLAMLLPQSMLTNETVSTVVGALYFVVLLIFILPSVAVQIRRLHDINKSGWWLLLSFIPGVGSLVLFIFACLKGTAGPNRFGPDPLNPLAPDVEAKPAAPAAHPVTQGSSSSSHPTTNEAVYRNTGRDVRNDSINADRRDG